MTYHDGRSLPHSWGIPGPDGALSPAPTLDEDTGQTMNVLLVGSDSRARLTGEQAAQAGKGQVTGERTDTIMVVHIDPRSKRAVLVRRRPTPT